MCELNVVVILSDVTVWLSVWEAS